MQTRFTSRLTSALLFTVMLIGVSVRAELISQPGTVPYYTSLAEAQAEAAKSKRAVAIDFVTDWCVWCKVMDTTLYKEQAGLDFYSKEAVLCKLDAEKADSLLAKKYGVVAYPTVVYCKADGTEYDRVIGYAPTGEYLTMARDYIAGKGTLTALLAENAKTPSRELSMQIAEKYQYRDKKEEARSWLTKVIGDGKISDSLSGMANESIVDMLRNDKKYDEALIRLAAMEKQFAGTRHAEVAVRKTGGTFLRMGDTTKAIAEFERYMKLYPDKEATPSIEKLLNTLKTATVKP